MASFKEKESELNREVRLYLSNPNNVDAAAEAVLNDLVDTVILGIVFEVHRAAKMGLVGIEDGITDEVKSCEIVEETVGDIFGQHPIKKRPNPECPNCKRSKGAFKFAEHLEKCMGMGRKSSRIASIRIAKNSKESSGYGGISDDDCELSLGSDRRRRKRDRNGTRRPKSKKTGHNGDISGDAEACAEFSSTCMNYDTMTNEERKNLLMQICGVISVNTRKLCSRSMRCPQHSDEQRRAVRLALMNCAPGILQVDMDCFEDTDGQSMRETLGHNWEQEHCNISSPADSASTSSSSSKKREKIPKSKNNNGSSSSSSNSSSTTTNNNNNNNNKSSSKNHKGSPSFVNCMQD